jgi:hypothetical protein
MARPSTLRLQESPSRAATPAWLRRPADIKRLKTFEEYQHAINDYFTTCDDEGIQPLFSGLALVLGLPGIETVYRLARRKPELTEILSRAITAIAHGYEAALSGPGARGAIFALQHLKDFDLEEPAGSAPVQSWKQQMTVDVNQRIVGVVDPATLGRELSPEEAYLTIIKGGQARIQLPAREIAGECTQVEEMNK